jgi:hypothetical protein
VCFSDNIPDITGLANSSYSKNSLLTDYLLANYNEFTLLKELYVMYIGDIRATCDRVGDSSAVCDVAVNTLLFNLCENDDEIMKLVIVIFI